MTDSLKPILHYVYSEKLLKILLAVLIAFLAYQILKHLFRSYFKRVFALHIEEKIFQQRARTVEQLVLSIIKLLVGLWLIFTLLDLFGLDVKALVLSAGIAGIAISFGAQSLVKDLIAGFLMLIEGQFDVGDYLVIGNKEGLVLSISTRFLTLLAPDGSFVQIPFGAITDIINKSSIQEAISRKDASEIVNKLKEMAAREEKMLRFALTEHNGTAKLLIFIQGTALKKKIVKNMASIVGGKPWIVLTRGRGTGIIVELGNIGQAS